MIGWTSLRAAMRSWGFTTEQDLSQWLRRQGFPGPQLGNHISGFDEAEEDTTEGILAVKFIMGRDLAVTRSSLDPC